METIGTEEAPPSKLPDDESDFEDELSVLEYARFHSIVRDHLNPEIPLSNLLTAHQNHESIHADEPVLILETEKLPTVCTLLPEGHTYPKDSPSVPKEALSFLSLITGKTALQNESLEVEENANRLLDARSKGTALEVLELPILRSDAELDFACFKCREEPVVEDLKLPREPIDEKRGQGLEWGVEMNEVVGKIHDKVAREKVTVEAKSIQFLLATIRDEWNEEDDAELWDQQTRYKRNMAYEPLTPPLQPLSPPTVPFVPSSPVMELSLLSDPPSLIDADLQAAEAGIFKDDTVTLSRIEMSSLELDSSNTMAGDRDIEHGRAFSSFASPEGAHTTPEPQSTRLSDLKIEVPLTPSNPVPKRVTFNNIIEEGILNCSTDEERTSYAPSQDGFEEEQSFFEEALEPIAEAVNRKVEQEQLKSADSLSRVSIPLMDFSLTSPPWAQLPLNGSFTQLVAYQRALIRDTVDAHSIPRHWPGSRKMEKELRWVPFSSELAKVAINEQIDGEDGLAELLSVVSVKELLNASSLTWKPEGLRILKDGEDDDEDEELELGHFYEKQSEDLPFLLKKRKLELQEERNKTGSRNSNSRLVSGSSEYRDVEDLVRVIEPKCKRRKPSPIERIDTPLPIGCQALLTLPHKRPESATSKERQELIAPKHVMVEGLLTKQDSPWPSLLLGGSLFSAGNALDNFMEIRGSKKQKLTDSSYFSTATNRPASNQHRKRQDLPQIAPVSLAKSTNQSIPLPTLTPERQQTPRNAIISSTTLKNRALINHLTTLLPNLTIIERDFSAHNTTIWQLNSVSRSPIASSLDSEADIIISPSTSIIITSLQAIKQKALPGSKTKNKVQERILSVAARYERILVFITGIDQSTFELNEDDCAKLVEFTGFCCAPFSPSNSPYQSQKANPTTINETSPTILINFTPGPLLNLATHIAFALTKYSPQHPDSFLEEETVWELFIRRCGMNAWAAQSIIGALKEPEGVNATNSPSKKAFFGIRAFVEMGGEERLRRFEGLVGGRRVLERVGLAVDDEWRGMSGW